MIEKLDSNLRQVITSKQAWHYRIVPKHAVNGSLELFIEEKNSSENIKKELSLILGKKVSLLPTSKEEIKKGLNKHYGDGKSKTNTYYKDPTKFLENMILEASMLKSSDVHIEHYEESCRVRFRVDGKMLERFAIKPKDYQRLVNRIKVAADLDIAERRLPQDGRIQFNELGESFDIRVSVLPSLHGEKVVLRLLKKDASNLDIEKLGFSIVQLKSFRQETSKPNGIILVSGPTGSGKTTTLYSTLRELNQEDVNIMTVEDPIEYTLPGVNHVQTNDKIGLSFASVLRSFLRQDPDIIMLGEIRDGETADMAIRAALTGHLVLSTIHTNSAWGTISRLIDMGVPAFLLASTINISLAQRLVRVLCPHCKEVKEESDVAIISFLQSHFQLQSYELAKPIGCEKCFYTGYLGRKAIYEVLPIDDILKQNIISQQFDISDYIKKNQIDTLSSSALSLLTNQTTSFEEVHALLING